MKEEIVFVSLQVSMAVSLFHDGLNFAVEAFYSSISEAMAEVSENLRKMLFEHLGNSFDGA